PLAVRKVRRRNFVKAAAVTGAAALTTRAGFADALSRSAARASAVGREDLVPRLGVASYSLRNFSRQQAIEMTRSLGVRYINFKSVHLAYDASPAEFAAAKIELGAAGLELVGGGLITFETDTDDGVRKYFDYARSAGMPLIVFTAKASVLPLVDNF